MYIINTCMCNNLIYSWLVITDTIKKTECISVLIIYHITYYVIIVTIWCIYYM